MFSHVTKLFCRQIILLPEYFVTKLATYRTFHDDYSVILTFGAIWSSRYFCTLAHLNTALSSRNGCLTFHEKYRKTSPYFYL